MMMSEGYLKAPSERVRGRDREIYRVGGRKRGREGKGKEEKSEGGRA